MLFKNKKCHYCEEYFIPKSGTQIYCFDCIPIIRAEYKKNHREKNRKKYNEYSKKWYQKNKKQAQKIKRNWRENNKTRDRELNLKLYYKYRDIRKREMISRGIARKIVKKIKCTECGEKKGLQIHHIDGNCFNNDIKNLIVLCRTCHYKKHKYETT